MGLFVLEEAKQIQIRELVMDQRRSQSSSSATKIERRIVEKNRRNNMKALYSILNSLLPPLHSKEIQTLPDQIDEAISHIKSMEARLSKLEEKKKSLLSNSNNNSNCGGTRKRCYSRFNTATSFETLNSPRIEIHENGPALEVVLITGLDDHFVFYDLIRILNEERADIVNANFSVSGDSIFHVVNAQQIAESIFGAAKLSERLKRCVSGCVSDVELQQEWWEDLTLLEIQPEMLDLF